MVHRVDNDILTRDVLDWKDMHLFHTQPSSCSQTTRIVLNLKEGVYTKKNKRPF